MNKLLLFLSFSVLIFSQCTEESAYQPKEISLGDEVTIDQIHEAYINGDYNVQDVVQFYLDRIEKIDNSGPTLNSVITTNKKAMASAKALDDNFDPENMPPLFGIPVLLKDNIDTKDSMPNTAGSRVMQNSIPNRDAPLVAQLREAGAIILGKTNLSEWANFHSDMSSSGWSGLGGQTNNPYVLDHNPCGSSAGSGVAVSANLCVLAIGTETNGSIVCPSTLNGIVGIKPTVGLISRTGIIPISHTHDTSGPMARTVKDAVIALGTMTSVDTKDSATSVEDRKSNTDYTASLNTDGIKGKRIGYYSKPLEGDTSEMTQIMENALDELRANGAEIFEIKNLLDPKTEAHSFVVMQYEFKDGVNKYLASLGDAAPVKNLDEVIEKTFADSIEMKFDHNLLKTSNERGDLNDPFYLNALDSMLLTSREEGIDKAMRENDLDAIVAITGGPAWKTDHVNGDKYEVYSSSPAAIAGYPSITVPMGFVGELPIGISFFGRAWSEPTLIEIAYAYEQKTMHRKSPKYIK
jgi:amidase